MKVLFAPDYRKGNPYQTYLAEALGSRGVEVFFLSSHKRGLPLYRGTRTFSGIDLLHLHWPDRYFGKYLLGNLRYSLDLNFSLSGLPMVWTAHNLTNHRTNWNRISTWNHKLTANRAKLIFSHSNAATSRICETYSVNRDKIVEIVHGDLSRQIFPPVSKEKAKTKLNLGSGRNFLMFGLIDPYKGIESIIDFWANTPLNWNLNIVGGCFDTLYLNRLKQKVSLAKNISIYPKFLSDEHLSNWIFASDAVIFNYTKILTSGSACLARSAGLKILIPKNLDTIDLCEPSPGVYRFENNEKDFLKMLDKAVNTHWSYEKAADWRWKTSWDKVADITLFAYRNAAGN